MVDCGELENTLLCLWKKAEQNEKSTTFSEVRRVGKSHKLYDCIECSGKPYSCPNYIIPRHTMNGYRPVGD